VSPVMFELGFYIPEDGILQIITSVMPVVKINYKSDINFRYLYLPVLLPCSLSLI
jgi:hypothetical protein